MCEFWSFTRLRGLFFTVILVVVLIQRILFRVLADALIGIRQIARIVVIVVIL
jgi:hypothetical protein